MSHQSAPDFTGDDRHQAWTLDAAVGLPTKGQILEAQTCEGQRVCLAGLDDGRLVAFQADCPHRGVPLCHGALQGEEVICLDHFWRWRLSCGSRIGTDTENGASRSDLRIYSLVKRGETLKLIPRSP